MDEEERLITRFVARHPHLSFENLIQGATFWLCRDTWREIALAWARQAGARYALTGSVDEWRYKVGVDGEAAVGVVLSIVDVESGRAVWSGSGAQSGWSREALSGVAQRLLRRLLGAGLSGRTN